MDTTAKLIRDETSKKVDVTLYRSVIGRLLYITASRPDICFSVGVCARYQSVPTELHLTSMKRILKYLAGAFNFCLWYSCDTNLFLVGFSDSNWASNIDDSKSTSGGYFYVGTTSFLCTVKCKTPSRFPLLKRSTLMEEVVALKFFG
ncbi:secreted RxLR effector protein 161-like [Humulus lupulus]|uniref:secreted RxLR effector protein 161-like n=1 Tax=Humulus lupulus TaxID=3486 RepID=UPI002B413C05|nr:secreted RxLR effector protein 161-like [Humulus lupulus]